MSDSDRQQAQGQPRSRIYSLFLGALLVAALGLAWVVALPFVHTLILAGVLSIIFHPLYLRFLGRFGGRAALASLATVSLIVFAILLPLSFFGLSLVSQGIQSLTAVNRWLHAEELDKYLAASSLEPYVAWLKERLPFVTVETLDIQSRILEISKGLGQAFLQTGTYLFGNAARLVFHFLLMIFMVFYFLRDGQEMVGRIKYLCPLKARHEDALIESFQRVSRSVLLGSLLIAGIQGLVAGVGVAVVGFPALFWGAMMGFASLIPVVGSAVIWAPMVGYLFVVGEWGWGVFLLLWCGVLVGGIDTVVRPMFMRGASGASTLYIFLSILGGINTFGALGILYGPLILTFVMIMLEIYGEEFREALTGEGGCPPHRPPDKA